jgi:predicted short-subunit dehydrogenase-like oxidoreductase (DUF2520 family)
MRIGFIGAGKVATAFGRYLYSKNLTISGYYDRHTDKVAHAVTHTQSQAFQSTSEAAAQSDMVLITTRDDQIAGVCRQLCEQNCITPGHLVGHMSGAHSSHILTGARESEATVFSLHPLQAFADEEKSLADLPNTYFSLEAENGGLDPIKKMLSQMGNPYFTLSPEHKSLYHLSACMLSNYLVTLMASGLCALEKSGIDPKEGFTAMRPLIDGTLANIAQLGPAQALTGPIVRGDAGTIEQHMAALKSMGLDSIRSVYTAMGLQTLELATEELLKAPDKAAALRHVLEEK